MIPFGDEVVTLFHRQGSGCERIVIGGCSWRRGTALEQAEGLWTAGGRVVVRMPPGQAMPRVGDVLVRGAVDDPAALGLNAAALIEKYRDRGAFLCRGVMDNAGPGAPLAHWRVTG